MSEQKENNIQLEQGTYEIIKNRLGQKAEDLRQKLNDLNEDRKSVFGSIPTQLLTTERITTNNNCLSKDMAVIYENQFIFGYNVKLGLKTTTNIDDVFSCYDFNPQTHSFTKTQPKFLQDKRFIKDFENLYQYYRETQFIKFAVIDGALFMVFQIGKTADDIKTFKWELGTKEPLYIDNRSDHEFKFPNQHEFVWHKATRDMQRQGEHPHISILDKVFVETIGGDLTIKVEDNTSTGKGIYAEKVNEKDQTLDDAEIYFAEIHSLIALKIRPYREDQFRYFIFNSKLQEAVRVDEIEDSAVLLPEGHGLIFAKGYYLQNGSFKIFDNELADMVFEKRIGSPNGEDYLYIFYQKQTGTYALLSYNLIEQTVDTPIICNGYSFFDNGELIYFKAEEDSQKHHAIQVWQTPYYSPNLTIDTHQNNYLFKIGNKEIVQAMSESQNLIKLIQRGDTYESLYIDLVKAANDILDTFHWLGKPEAHHLSEPIGQIKTTASKAIEEFEKVVQIKKSTSEQVSSAFEKANKTIKESQFIAVKSLAEYIDQLQEIRTHKGAILGLKDLRYAPLDQITDYENLLQEAFDSVSHKCVSFLLKPESLLPYQNKVDEIRSQVESISKVIDADALGQEIISVSKNLEMLIETVSNLKIDDATETTRIIDNISNIYAQFNQINVELKKKRKALLKQEGESEFNAKLKLINQGVSNFLDISKTPEKCDEYMNKLMVQLEELEGKFIEFDEYIEKISLKRDEIYNAFESQKTQLIEARNNRAISLHESGERIIKSVKNRINTFKEINEILTYQAADMMVQKVYDIEKQLIELGDTVKADDLTSQLKSTFEEGVRQLKDKKELFTAGDNAIQLGKHIFNVNTQPLDLTLVQKKNEMFYHLSGTEFYEPIEDAEFNTTQEVWNQRFISENNLVYRSEYLAHEFIQSYTSDNEQETTLNYQQLTQLTAEELKSEVVQEMSKRYDEGYTRGIHEDDAAKIISQYVTIFLHAGLLRFSVPERAYANLFWEFLTPAEDQKKWRQLAESLKAITDVFPKTKGFTKTVHDLSVEMKQRLADMVAPMFNFTEAANYLLLLLIKQEGIPVSYESKLLTDQFKSYLKKQRVENKFEQSIKSLPNVEAQFRVAQQWISAYIENHEESVGLSYFHLETAFNLIHENANKHSYHTQSMSAVIEGLKGQHNVITENGYQFGLQSFHQKMKDYQMVKEKFNHFQLLKKELLEEKKSDLRIQEYQPKILSSFVRNQLINEVYLPLIGDNLAKQIGTAGADKRTDLMGMLLLISPPGYGKTTLMEYIANRLGLIFMKINGPALGHSVTSVDPSSADNSAAREELEKLNLAFEMGDNVMIYVDDIQHCHPEFLQKFISLCDAQRKIEGVYNGVSKTYDLKGKKVAVVMAGNPYTESGEKFQVPDMLVNRADVYNLGDMIGGKEKAFKMSYLENAITSNKVIAPLNSKSKKDLYQIIQLGAGGDQEGLEFDHHYSAENLADYVNIFEKMITVRDIILKVNQMYIHSAGQSDAFRTEPPFKLQGSYRDMNKIVEKLNVIMNPEELNQMILTHYIGESQTLTSGAEFNLLKFKQMFGVIEPAEKERLNNIVNEFIRQQKFANMGGNQMSMVIESIEDVTKALDTIGLKLKP